MKTEVFQRSSPFLLDIYREVENVKVTLYQNVRTFKLKIVTNTETNFWAQQSISIFYDCSETRWIDITIVVGQLFSLSWKDSIKYAFV